MVLLFDVNLVKFGEFIPANRVVTVPFGFEKFLALEVNSKALWCLFICS